MTRPNPFDGKAWEELVAMIGTIGIVLTTDQERAILAADAELIALRAEVERGRGIVKGYQYIVGELRARVAVLEKVRDYAAYQHRGGCGYTFDHVTQTGETVDECTCGMDAALDALGKEKKDG
jgi:hypothetical protein